MGGSHGRAAYLQVVLERLWEAEREEGSSVIRLATLERLGGARRIVGEHLDRALSALNPAELDTAAAMFSHLVTPSGAKVAHDVDDLAAYAGVDEAAARDVTASLVDERILRPVEGPQGDGSRVEIFHDVLAAAVAAWGRDHEAARVLEAERAEAGRKHRRLLALVVTALIALAGMTLVAIYAVAQQREADDQRALASSEARVAKGSALAAQALQVLPTNPALALKYAATAATIDPTRGEDVLRRTLVESRQRNVFGNRRDEVVAASFSPDGKTVALATAAGRVVVAPRLGRPLMRRRHGRSVNALAFVRNDRLVTASSNGTIAVWDLRTRRRVRTLTVGAPVLALAVSSDGRLVAAGAGNRRLSVWGVRSGKRIRDWPFPAKVEHVSFDARGERLLAAGRGRARLFDVPSGLPGAPFDAEGRVIAAALSPGGRLVATGGKGKHAVARVWDATSGVVLSEIRGHTNGIVDVEFDRLGTLLVTASADGTARVYNVTVPRRPLFVAPLIGHTANVLSARFSPDGKRVVTASKDNAAAVWRPQGNLLVSLVGHNEDVYGAELNRDGRYALTWSADGTARVWDAEPEPIMTPRQASAASLFGRCSAATQAWSPRSTLTGTSP